MRKSQPVTRHTRQPRSVLLTMCWRLGVSLALISASVEAEEFYLAPPPVGNDANPGSLAQPWATLAKANSELAAGDTVWILAGMYPGVIRPDASGASNASRITYRAYGDGDVVLTAVTLTSLPESTGTIGLTDRNYVTVSGRAPGDSETVQRIKIRPDGYTDAFASVCGGEGNIVENIDAQCAATGPTCSRGFAFCIGFWAGNRETRYNVLRNSILRGGCSTESDETRYTEDLITVAQNAHHNLIENNDIERCRHSSLYADSPDSYSNVVRGNRIANLEHTALSIFSAGVNHPEGARFLVENNVLLASADNPAPDGNAGNAFQWGSDELIIRHNVISRGGVVGSANPDIGGIIGSTSTSFGQPYFATDGRVYHNTIVDNRGVAIGMFDYQVESVDLGRHKFVNNILYGSSSNASANLLALYWDDGRPTNDRYIRNIWGMPGGDPNTHLVIQNSVGAATLATAISTWQSPDDPNLMNWNGWDNEYSSDPGFVDYVNADYTLAAGNPLLNSGAPLTRVANSDTGGGTTLFVDDARFLFAEAFEFPAWMGVLGETLRIGPSFQSAVEVQVTGVNDDAGQVTLAGSVTRTIGDYVWVVRDSQGKRVLGGSGPALGAIDTTDELFADGFESGDTNAWD